MCVAAVKRETWHVGPVAGGLGLVIDVEVDVEEADCQPLIL